MSHKQEVQELGTFEVRSGKLIVSDPCYDREIVNREKTILENVLNGNWVSEIVVFDEGTWGKRVGYLIANSINHICSNDWQAEKFTVGVDSGQVGIFDEPQYHGGDDDFDDENGWYRMCCNHTLGEIKYATCKIAGTIAGGVVSSSGYGDGCYECSTIKVDDKIVAVRIDFGLEEEDEDND